ncbi:MAG: LPS-assembly protein LptD [Lewinellaceae bacterium]|nr:LPS-assembly protein LptD [Lewinellaceae bacterium]
MKANAAWIILLVLSSLTTVSGQDSSRVARPVDTVAMRVDTLPGNRGADSAALVLPLRQIRFSNDSLDAPVDYTAVDSMILDNVEKKIYLYGDAFIQYQEITLKAAEIILDWENNLVMAEMLPSGEGKPEFSDGEQDFVAERMRYNFKTRKGIVYDVTTQQNDVVVHGARTKFISGEKRDSLPAQDVLYSEDAIFTTCTAEHPHFGIHSTRQKIVPNKLIIVGPSQLEIMDIPTPLWLPFGFFPISKGGSTGLLFPRDYEYSPQWGFGLRDIGWYFPLGEHFNLSLRSNIYLRGTWGISATSDYRRRYKYSGNFNLAFDSRRTENLSTGEFSPQRSFQIRWSHRQDPTAHPINRFGGSINIQTNSYQNRVFNDANSVLQTQLNSNMTFDKNWTDRPYSLSLSFNHSQNRLNRSVTINFPDFRFLTQSLYPFKRKVQSGKERWYETIVMRYRGEVRNRFEATDTTLFSSQTLERAKFGVNQEVTANTSFKLLKFFNFNPSVTYREVWQMQSLDKNFDPTPTVRADTIYNADSTLFEIQYDTLQYGTLRTDTLTGFASYRTLMAGISLNTRIFSTLQLRKGFLRALRHELRPSISLNYSPDYLDPYYQEVLTDSRFPDRTQRFSPFEQGIYGAPPQSGQQMALAYSLNNIFQAKVFSRRDSTLKNVKLIDNLVVGGSYNLAADSLRWSPIFVSTTARFFKGATTASFGMTLDPYIVDANNRRINTTTLAAKGQLVRMDRASLRFTSNLTVGKIRALFQGKEEEVVEDVRDENALPGQFDNDPNSFPVRRRATTVAEAAEQDFLSLFENFSISHNIEFSWVQSNGQVRFGIGTNSINARGNIALTKNWAISVGNFGYDFENGGLSYPSFGFLRDLHCWEMSFNWQPQRGTYSFNIRVKPGTLDFIKIPYQRNNADGFRNF